MIIALVAVSGLQGSDRGQQVSVKDERALTQAFDQCVDSKSYSHNNCKRPIVVCCLKETNDKEVMRHLTQKVIDKECKSIDVGFARRTKVYWYPDMVTKIKNVDSDEWIDHNDTERVMLCNVFNLGGTTKKEDFSNINTLLARHPRTPMLVVATSSDLKSICEEVGAGIKSCDVELASALLESAKKLALDEMDNALSRGTSLDEFLKQSEELSFKVDKESRNDESVSSLVQHAKRLVEESKSFDKKQPSYLSAFSNFFTNHWGKLAGGVSLAVLFAYYYNFVRQ